MGSVKCAYKLKRSGEEEYAASAWKRDLIFVVTSNL